MGVAFEISMISHSIPEIGVGQLFTPEVAEYVILKQVAGQRLKRINVLLLTIVDVYQRLSCGIRANLKLAN